VARALGLEIERLAALPHGDGRDQIDAEAMHTLLWSATGGYLVDHLGRDDPSSAGIFSADTRQFVRRHFIERVRARGPLPTLRIGAQPYGLLPVTSTAGWSSYGNEESQLGPLVAVVRTALVPLEARDRQGPVGASGLGRPRGARHRARVAVGPRARRERREPHVATNKFDLPDGDPRKPRISASAQVDGGVLPCRGRLPEGEVPPLFAAKDQVRLWFPLAAPVEGESTEARIKAAARLLERVMDDRMLSTMLLDEDPRTLLAVLARYAATLELKLAAEEEEALKKLGGRLSETTLTSGTRRRSRPRSSSRSPR